MNIELSPTPLPVKHAIAASFDLSGFSTFCRGPNAHAILPRYLAAVFQVFAGVFEQFFPKFFEAFGQLESAPEPDFIKYTGDGALMLWIKDDAADFSPQLCTSIVIALRTFQQKLPAHVNQWESQWRTTGLPRQARVGIAVGPVHPLNAPLAADLLQEDVVDYVGYCINLAVRLQDHCPEVGFHIHHPLNPHIPGLVPAVALEMKGTLEEPVFLFPEDIERLQQANPAKTARFYRF